MVCQLDVLALLNPALYDHEVGKIQLVETHISWVLLTGPYAYKIKKALDLHFLDFSTLEKRRFYCHEELRLNRRLAPHIYLDVIPITGSHDSPRMGGSGTAIEYAVKMRQFSQQVLLDRLVAEGKLPVEQLDAITARVAEFHRGIPPAPPESPFGRPERARIPVDENFRQILPLVTDRLTRKRLEAVKRWADDRFETLTEAMAERKSQGYIRECHGDMHLGNMALVDGEIVIFDGIEFNDNLRWIDVMSEVAFLSSDLEHRGRPDYEWRFLNGYLESTGDYAGLRLLRYYQAYRAMVRAKVTCIRLSQADLPAAEQPVVEQEFQRYLSQAERYTHPGRAMLVLMRGVSGSGKTAISQGMLERMGAIRVRSDVERKRLFSMAAQDRSQSMVTGGIYTAEATAKTYQRLRNLTKAGLEAGLPVIVDATFLQRAQRDPFGELAAKLGVPCHIVDTQAEEAILRQRVQARLTKGTDASEAGIAVLEHQLQNHRALDEDEQPFTVAIDSGKPVDVDAIVSRLRPPRKE